ncbi:MAG: hypothetical protein OZSIB_3312 [Candidatus Ozemobacter sibiricus]|jgi:hypothetical protein|uniref:Uncharacterized protein n=1 Tax=Candidatus Ozemobacter sibiricus TaxID=2268124 RepID=A0A367ZF30_9BACT|nr:MAG: hypothetical protein OZSIB_3312 [Candidatus Ozemobacter sibiricus]
MSRTRPRLPWMAVLLLAAASHAALAATTQIPPWYTLTATLEAPPQIKVPVVAKVTVGAPLVDLQDLEIVLVPPAGWAGTATPSQRLDRLAAGETRTLSFTLTPTGPVAHGSIVVFLRTPVPKGAIQEALRATMGEDGPAMAERVAAWPAHGEGITEIAFSLLPEESFYPLTGDMWTTYDDRLKKEPALRGPVLFREAVVTPFQAQTDVDMHDRLTGLLQTDPTLAGTLEAQGIDLARKRQDLLLGLYVLATEAYLKGETATAQSFLARLQNELAQAPPAVGQALQIPAGNLRGLLQWSMGDRKAAEETLRATFYRDRKAPVQRYLLRNLGLLMLEKGDQTTAREMFRLALELKPAYTLLQEEYARLKKP